MKYKYLLLISLLLLAFGGLQAQQTVPTSGGEASGGNGSISYSIGQVLYTTSVGSNGNTVAKGVQQPYEISITNDFDITIDIKIYPNPTLDDIIIETDNSSLLKQSYIIYDVQGKLISKNEMPSSKTIINMSNFSNGVYFIEVSDTEKKLKVFKIIKLTK